MWSETFKGVRPVITLSRDAVIINPTATGSANDPFRFTAENASVAGSTLNSRYGGEYVRFGNLTWRIARNEPNDGSAIGQTRLILADYHKVSGNHHYVAFGPSAFNPTNGIGGHLNNESVSSSFIMQIPAAERAKLQPMSLNVNPFVTNQGQNPLSRTLTPGTVSARVGLPSVGDIFSGRPHPYENTIHPSWPDTPFQMGGWLINRQSNDTNQGWMNTINLLTAQNTDISSIYRPVIQLPACATIASGNGRSESTPFVLSFPPGC